MEKTLGTASVDVNKLQLLNDRLCQTIDALNQLRMSTYSTGFNHAGGYHGWANPVVPNFGTIPGTYPAVPAFGATPFINPAPYAQVAGNGYGLSHSVTAPWMSNPWNLAATNVNPYGYGMIDPRAVPPTYGISHSTYPTYFSAPAWGTSSYGFPQAPAIYGQPVGYGYPTNPTAL